MKSIISALAVAILLAGCSYRIRPGGTTTSIGGVSTKAVQSQDPKDNLTQDVDSAEEAVVPAGSEIVTGTGTNAQRIVLAEPMAIKRTHSVKTKVGASQKNTAQEIGAKLAGIRWLQVVGIALALFGIASMTWPPLKLIISSTTTSMWCIIAGAALVFIPIVIVGHELLILGVAGGVVALWFFAHRHGAASKEVSMLREIVDDQPKQ